MGNFLPDHEAPHCCVLLRRPTSDTSVATLRWAPCCSPRCCGARGCECRQTVSTPSAVTRSKISRSEVPSLGKRLTTLHALYRSPIVNRRRPRNFAHRASTIDNSSPYGLPRSVCSAARIPLVRDRDTSQNACTLARIHIRWARPPFTCFPFLTLGNRFCGSLPLTDFCRSRFDVRAHSRAPSSSPALGISDPLQGRVPL